MKCRHCLVEFHPRKTNFYLGTDKDGVWGITCFDCPACNRMNLYLVNGKFDHKSKKFDTINSISSIRPKGSSHSPCPSEVPPSIAEDYEEACIVLPDSPKASAALSRRCLQNLLRDVGKVKPGNLANEIQQVIDSGNLPSHLVKALDMVRQIGNFAAHPMKSNSTGEIVPVEPEEAEWDLEVLEALFDFYYVQPKQLSDKIDTLNTKLVDIGKNPIK